MKKVLLIGLVSGVLLIGNGCLAATYYTVASGSWTGAIWSTSPTGPASTLPALNNGDVLIIDENISLTTNITIAADITIVLDATFAFNNGKLALGAGSIIQFNSSNARIVSLSGNNDQITIGGGQEWKGGEGNITGPGYINDGWNCCTLPITLLSFEASAGENTVVLSWATSMEEDFSRFIVQRSSDGLTFFDLGEVPGKGFNIYDIISKYSFEDPAPLIGFNYYRLKAIDFDDSFEYFGVKAVKVTASKDVAIFPNPSNGNHINFRTNFGAAETDRIVLHNQLGVAVFNGPARDFQGGISLQNPLRAGIYLLRYISKDFEQSVRVVVKD